MCKSGFNCVALSRCDHFAVNQNNSQHWGKIATSISSTTSRRSVLHCDWGWDNQIQSEDVQKHIWHSSALLQHCNALVHDNIIRCWLQTQIFYHMYHINSVLMFVCTLNMQCVGGHPCGDVVTICGPSSCPGVWEAPREDRRLGRVSVREGVLSSWHRVSGSS